MKKIAVLLVALTTMTLGAFAESKIELVAPQITDWGTFFDAIPEDSHYNRDDVIAQLKGDLTDSTNASLRDLFKQSQDKLNGDVFSRLHDQTQLARGFANSNAAAFDNASLLSFQTYDLFAVMGGFNLAGAVPTTDPSKIAGSFNDVTEKGDVYLGLATGGAAVQAGLNLGFLVPNLYVSGKLGLLPAYSLSTTANGLTTGLDFKQGMFGVGVNYTLFPQIDLLFGFIKWRGLSVGSGVTYNSNATKLTLGVAPLTNETTIGVRAAANAVYNGLADKAGFQDLTVVSSVSNVRSVLTIENSSLVIPVELMTSLQALWFLNVGLGGGLDITYPSSRITLGGGADLGVTGLGPVSLTPAKVNVVGTDSKGVGDMFVPRLAASLGLNVAILKIEIPLSYYPTTKAFAFGVSSGIVW